MLFSGDAFDPEHPHVGDGENHDGEADWKADEAIALGEVDLVAGGEGDEETDDAEEGGKEEGGHAGGEADEERGEPAHVSNGRAEDVAVEERLMLERRGKRAAIRGGCHSSRITLHG